MNHLQVASTARRRSGLDVLDRDGRLRFLLVEDSPSDRELVRALLRRELPHAVIDVASRLDDALGMRAERGMEPAPLARLLRTVAAGVRPAGVTARRPRPARSTSTELAAPGTPGHDPWLLRLPRGPEELA